MGNRSVEYNQILTVFFYFGKLIFHEEFSVFFFFFSVSLAWKHVTLKDGHSVYHQMSKKVKL